MGHVGFEQPWIIADSCIDTCHVSWGTKPACSYWSFDETGNRIVTNVLAAERPLYAATLAVECNVRACKWQKATQSSMSGRKMAGVDW